MKTAELTGAMLDYWTARAEGVPATQLFFYQTPYSGETICGRHVLNNFPVAVRYSTDWAQGGQLLEKYRFDHVGEESRLEWTAYFDERYTSATANKNPELISPGGYGYGDTPLQAICRAVVRAAFGDVVEEVAG